MSQELVDGGFRIGQVIGRGNMGEVHRAEDLHAPEGTRDGNPWGVPFMHMFDMANDSQMFRPDAQRGETFEDPLKDGWNLKGNVLVRREEPLLPLYEAKTFHHYDHRFSTPEGATEKQLNKGTLPRFTVEQHEDTSAVPMPRYWAPEQDVPSGEFDKSGKEIKLSGVRSRLGAGNILLPRMDQPAELLYANTTSMVLDYVP